MITVTATDTKENMRMRAKRLCNRDVAILEGGYELLTDDLR